MSDTKVKPNLVTDRSITPWATLKVPGASESYFRLGYRNRDEESRYLDLCVPHAPDKANGVFFGTDGDYVQVVKRSAATRILDGNYYVYVQDDETIADLHETDATASSDAPAAGGSDNRSYRAYFRLGKPESPLESVLSGTVAVEDARALVGEFLPTALSTHETAVNCARLLTQAVTGEDSGVVPVTPSNGDDAPTTADCISAARTALETKARYADRRALDSILMAFDERGGGNEAEEADAKSWADGVLRTQLPFHLRNAYLLEEPGGSRAKLLAYAKDGGQPAHQGAARRAIAFVAETRATGDDVPSGLMVNRTPQDVRAWVVAAKEKAGSHLKELDKLSGELLDRYTLGNGVALYSDRGIALNTPAELTVTVGGDSRTVFGPTFSLVYSVDDATIAKIKSGEIANLADVTDKKLVTATRVDRDSLIPGAQGKAANWRTTTIDRSKELKFSMSDSGALSASSSMNATFGTKFESNCSALFELKGGFESKASLGLEHEYSKSASLSDSTAERTDEHENKQTLIAKELKFSVPTPLNPANLTKKTWTNLLTGMIVATNVLQAAYTAYLLGATFDPNAKNDDETIKARMLAAEKVYAAIMALQVLALVGGIVLFVVEKCFKKAADAVNLFSPTQVPNITINDSGVKIQAGSNFIVVTKFGILLNGLMIENCGQTSHFPLIKASTLTEIQIEESVNFFGAIVDL